VGKKDNARDEKVMSKYPFVHKESTSFEYVQTVTNADRNEQKLTKWYGTGRTDGTGQKEGVDSKEK
jgi:hypothetical protein